MRLAVSLYTRIVCVEKLTALLSFCCGRLEGVARYSVRRNLNMREAAYRFGERFRGASKVPSARSKRTGCRPTALKKRFRSTRLETRTKESNARSSFRSNTAQAK